MKILIVDDDELLGTVLARMLHEHEAVAIQDPVAAIDAARRADEAMVPFEIVVCDMMLGTLSGRQVNAQLRALREPPVFVLMSGYDESLESAHDNGEVDGVLLKPFAASDLRRMIASLGRTRAARRRLSRPTAAM